MIDEGSRLQAFPRHLDGSTRKPSDPEIARQRRRRTDPGVEQKCAIDAAPSETMNPR